MENNAQPEEHGRGSNSESADTDPKRRKVSAAINRTLEAWFRRRELPENQNFFSDSEEDEEDDDDTPEYKKKTSKFRRALRSFFGTQVSREEIPAAPAAERTEQQPEQLASNNQAEQTQPAEANQPRYETPFDPMVAAQYERRLRGESPTSERNDNQPQTTPEELPEVPETATEASGEPQAEATADLPMRDGANEWVLIDRTQDQVQQQRAAERPDQPVPEVTKRDLKRVETKRYYGNRHRKRDVRELNEQVVDLKDEQKEAEQNAKTQTKAQEQLRERLARIETAFAAQSAAQKAEQQQAQAARAAETRPANTVERQVEATPPAERPTESVKEILAKREKPTQQPESTQMAQQARELANAHYEKTLQPQTVMEKVEQAAEQNIAIEGLFERRHEVKDEDSAMQNAGGSATASLPQTQTAMPFLSVQAQSPKKQPNVKDNVLSYIAPEYKQAARNGFFAAILLLAIILVIFFMR